MIPRKLVQTLMLFLFLIGVTVSTFILLRRQLAPLLQELGTAGTASVRVMATPASQNITPTVTLPTLTSALVATVPATATFAEPTPQAPTSLSPALLPATTTDRVGVVNSALINVRSYPSLAGEVLGQAKLGDRLEIIATSPDGEWLQVCCPLGTDQDNRQTWVAAEFILVQP